MTHGWVCRLGDNNSVFKAEIFTIFSELEWLLGQLGAKVPIYSYNLSGLQVLHAPIVTNKLVLKIKLRFKSLHYKTHFSHVSAHKGIFVNDCVDELAKQATKHTNIHHHFFQFPRCSSRGS